MPQSKIFQNFLAGKATADEEGRLKSERDLAQQATQGGIQSPEFKQLVGTNPAAASKIGNLLGQIGEDREKSFFQDSSKLNNLLKSGNVEGGLTLINNRLNEGDRIAAETGEAFDPSDTLEIRDALLQGDVQGVISTLDSVDEAGILSGLMPDPNKGRGIEKRTAGSKDFDQFQTLVADAKQETDPAIKAQKEKVATQFGRRTNFIKPTEQESADIKVSTAERKEIAKASIKRKQGFINNGITSADSTATLRRSLDILKTIKTGGFNNAMLNAKKFFGIEGADEAELSANMGRNVLAQLKPTFGAAFTVEEKRGLERISEGFGKSAPTNKRLMKQALRIAERSARRGIAAAEDQDQQFAADEIRAALEFKLDDKDFSAPTEPQGQVQTATGPNGEKVALINGQWVPQ